MSERKCVCVEVRVCARVVFDEPKSVEIIRTCMIFQLIDVRHSMHKDSLRCLQNANLLPSGSDSDRVTVTVTK